MSQYVDDFSVVDDRMSEIIEDAIAACMDAVKLEIEAAERESRYPDMWTLKRRFEDAGAMAHKRAEKIWLLNWDRKEESA